MTFREVQVEDCQWAKPLLEANHFKSCEYAFVNVYMWSEISHSEIARFEDFVIVRNTLDRLYYLFPAGNGDWKPAVDAILQDAKQQGRPPVLFSLTEKLTKELDALCPGKFRFVNPRGQSDYIYLASDLANLPGKKFQKKRNHCSRFERQYPDWQFHEITPDSLDAVCEFNNKWCKMYDNRDDAGIAAEHKAIELVCRHYDELWIKGGYITVNGEVVAFSFGSPLGKDMFVTHVEKASYDISGAYNIINREMARTFAQDYQYINRENDLDEEGLRDAKLSYHPVALEDKYIAEYIGPLEEL